MDVFGIESEDIVEKYYSQHGQDKYLEETIFKGKRNGVFLDIGASDGITMSNTYFFEISREWEGVYVEPREKPFKALVKNRKCFCEYCCVSDKSGVADFLELF